MSFRNKTERTPIINIKTKNKLLNDNNCKILGKLNPRKKNNEISKDILKGKLFSLINKSNIMTEEQFNDIKIKLSLSQLEKFKLSKNNPKRKFYYAQINPNIIQPTKNPNKFEDDYINMRELLKKFSAKEQDEILSFPQFFQLNSNEFLKELVEEKHRNLYEIIVNEENKEKELKNLKIKQRQELNSYKTNYINAHHSHSKKKIFKNNEKDEEDNENENLRKSKRIQLNIKNKDFSRNKKYSKYSIFNNQYTNSTMYNKISKTYNNINSFDNKKRKIIFQGNIWNKSKLSYKDLESKINEKYEKMRERKESIKLNIKKKMDEIKEKNRTEQMKKEKERKKIYQEKKFIDYISAKLKQNYSIKDNNNSDIKNKFIF